MREILFRGKTQQGKWVEGLPNYRAIEKTNGLMSWLVIQEIERNENNEIVSITNRTVIPETVGQFTGLTDKNGTKVFEGDLFRPEDDELCVEVVFLQSARFQVAITAFESEGYTKVIDYMDVSDFTDDVVIGNIHDNKELINQ